MSHNKIKVGGQSPSTSGEISVALDNLSDVSSTLTDNEMLAYVGSEFTTRSKLSTSSESYYRFIKTSDNYGTTASYSNNDYWVWRHSTGVNESKDATVTRNTATSGNSPINNSNWTESLTFTESGTYLFVACVAMGDNFTSNDSCNVQWSDGSAFSHKTHLNSEGVFGSTLWGIKTISSSTTFRMFVSDIVGTCRPISGEQALACSITIFKLNT